MVALLLGSFSYAHQPPGMYVQYSPKKKKLQVKVDHAVDNRYKHFIHRLEIQINEEAPRTYYPSRQNQKMFSFQTYPLAAQEGDVINVVAYCNINGSIEAVLTLTPDNFNDERATYEITAEKKSYPQLQRILDNRRFDRTHGRDDAQSEEENAEESELPLQPHNIVDSPTRRQLELESEIRKKVHENTFGY